MCEDLCLTPIVDPLGPWPMSDDIRFTVALSMVWCFLAKESELSTFYTIRGLRTVYSNISECPFKVSGERSVCLGETGVTLLLLAFRHNLFSSKKSGLSYVKGGKRSNRVGLRYKF